MNRKITSLFILSYKLKCLKNSLILLAAKIINYHQMIKLRLKANKI